MTWQFIDEDGLVAHRVTDEVIESSFASAIDEEILPYEPNIPELILRAKAETRIQRQPIIEILDGLQASALALGQPSRAQIIETAKQGLRDITDFDLSTCTTYEEMRVKVKARYIELALALPAEVRKAFSEAIH